MTGGFNPVNEATIEQLYACDVVFVGKKDVNWKICRINVFELCQSWKDFLSFLSIAKLAIISKMLVISLR